MIPREQIVCFKASQGEHLNYYTKMVHLLLELLIILTFCLLNVRTAKECITPDSKLGYCLPLKDCQHLYDLRNNLPLNRTSAKFLKRSECQNEFENDGVYVCCQIHDRDSKVPFKPSSLQRVPILGNRFQSNEEDCGIQFVFDRVHGGVVTELEEFPWMSLLLYKSKKGIISASCGGVLINTNFVLTAAHCVLKETTGSAGELIAVRLGEYDTQTYIDCDFEEEEYCLPLPVDVYVDEMHPHPDYHPGTKDRYNDIALVKLKNSVSFTNSIQPICLPPLHFRYEEPQHSNLWISGWGKTEKSRFTGSGIKLKAMVPVVEESTCKTPYCNNGIHLSSKQVCAGGGKTDSCEGDSGGPLMWKNFNNSKWYSVGIISFGSSPCAIPGIPAVYTKVVSYLNWIRNITN